jgi:hypothetical protein
VVTCHTGRLRGQRPQRQKTPASRIQNPQPDGKAATVAGGADPGFHTWPTGHTPQIADTSALIRIRSSARKTFGETFGEARAATVGSVVTCHTGRLRGQRPQRQKTPASRIQNPQPDGKAATVAGGADPGFHTWPTGHTPQIADTSALIRIRSSARKTFGETFGEARAATVGSVVTCHTGRLRGQRPQLQKTPASRIQNPQPDGAAATVAGGADPGFHTWPPGQSFKPPIRAR